MKRCKTYTLIIMITVAILLSKAVVKWSKLKFLMALNCTMDRNVDTEDAITSRHNIRTACKEMEMSLNVGLRIQCHENLPRISSIQRLRTAVV